MKKLAPKKLVLIALIVGVLLPVFNASAELFGIGSIAYSAANTIFGATLLFMFTIVGKLIAVMAVMLGWVLNIRVYTNIPVIEESWKIMRDFANMLFIIALIVMAYGTIFNIRGYDFRSLIPKFLIAALLINFSLVIGGLIIDATQVLNNTFLLAMGDISGSLGQGLNPAELLPDAAQLSGAQQADAIANLAFSSIITIFFSLILLLIFAVSLFVPLVFALVRIPILWILLIVSPMAWLLSIFPGTRKIYTKWWDQFLSWNLFLPYYLFFLYFGLYFLSRKDQVIAGLGQEFVYKSLPFPLTTSLCS